MVLAKCDVRFLGMHSASFFFLCVRFVRFHLSQSPFTREWGYGSGQVCGLLRCAELSTIIKFPRKRFDKATRQTIHSHPSPHPPTTTREEKVNKEREREDSDSDARMQAGCQPTSPPNHYFTVKGTLISVGAYRCFWSCSRDTSYRDKVLICHPVFFSLSLIRQVIYIKYFTYFEGCDCTIRNNINESKFT